ncbi:MAG: signal recognition particle-docking protein FtsY [Tissierellia bacterium]|nr:signal recognition particle-docking protein FtsY [Tissierellia bacterium]
MFKWIKEQFNKDAKENENDILSEDKLPEETPVEDALILEEELMESLEEEQEIEEAPTKGSEVGENTDSKLGFFAKLKQGLTKTKDGLMGNIDLLLKGYAKIDDELYEELEEILIGADVGMDATIDMIDKLQAEIKERKSTNTADIKPLLKEIIVENLNKFSPEERLLGTDSPTVILVVGVNGVGKTTTIGKLAHQLKAQGKKVVLAAGDTFRAAATDQLREWANRAGVDLIALSEGADPGAVIYDSVQAAKSRNADVLICDTAGRLHNKKNLMNELNKIFRIIDREYGEAKKEVLLVLDATTGQNALIQAKTFKEVANITGMALTKLDGSAKGGIIIALEKELEVPVKLVGVGEGISDLQNFDPDDFVNALFE